MYTKENSSLLNSGYRGYKSSRRKIQSRFQLFYRFRKQEQETCMKKKHERLIDIKDKMNKRQKDVGRLRIKDREMQAGIE